MQETVVKVLVPVALKEVFEDLVPRFQSTVDANFDLTHMLNPEVPRHVATDRSWDVALTNPEYADQIVEAGHAAAAGCVPFGWSPLSLAKLGRVYAKPLTDLAGIRELLLNAGSLALTDQGTSGRALRQFASEQGILSDLTSKIIAMDGGEPMRALLAGEVELAALPLSNVATMRGVRAVAICPLSAEVHIDFSLCTSPTASDIARTFTSWLLDPDRAVRLKKLGLERTF